MHPLPKQTPAHRPHKHAEHHHQRHALLGLPALQLPQLLPPGRQRQTLGV